MRRIGFLMLAVVSFSISHAQSTVSDSLKKLLSREIHPIKKFDLTKRLAYNAIISGQMDEALSYNKILFDIATQENRDSLLMLAYTATAGYWNYKTDSREVIEYCLRALQIAESRYKTSVPELYVLLSSAYNDLQNHEKAIHYAHLAREALRKENHPVGYLGAVYYQLSDAYAQLHRPDSVLHYAQLLNEILFKDESKNTELRKLSYTQLAQAYEQLGNYKMAESYIQNAIDSNTDTKMSVDAKVAQSYSNLLLKLGRFKEAKSYGLNGLNTAKSSQTKRVLLESVNVLRRIYESSNQMDSAYYFSNLELTYRDSLFNQEKLNAVQDMTFKEEVRQKEAAHKMAAEALQQKHNLQYAAIALGLIGLLILFLLLSHTIIVNHTIIRFLGALSLLILFEFINLLIHPFAGGITHHSPVLMLLIMVCVAALLIPLHHKLEHWMTHKLIEKNKRIRFAAAIKTMEELKGKINEVPVENGTDAEQ